MADEMLEILAHIDQEAEEAVDWFQQSKWHNGHFQRFMDLMVMPAEAFSDEAEEDEIDCIQRLARLAFITTVKAACEKFGTDEILALIRRE